MGEDGSVYEFGLSNRGSGVSIELGDAGAAGATPPTEEMVVDVRGAGCGDQRGPQGSGRLLVTSVADDRWTGVVAADFHTDTGEVLFAPGARHYRLYASFNVDAP